MGCWRLQIGVISQRIDEIVQIQGIFPVQIWIIKADIETVVIGSKEKVDRLLWGWGFVIEFLVLLLYLVIFL